MRTIEIDNLILVEVPKDAVNFELGNNLLYGSTLFFKINNAKYSGTDVIKGNFEIIGLIETPNLNFDFDVEDSWVEYIGVGKYPNPVIDVNSCRDYMNSFLFTNTKKKSFITRIQRKIQDNGFYLVNPLGSRKPKFTDEFGMFTVPQYIQDEDLELWEQAEEKTIKGNLLLIKKLK